MVFRFSDAVLNVRISLSSWDFSKEAGWFAGVWVNYVFRRVCGNRDLIPRKWFILLVEHPP